MGKRPVRKRRRAEVEEPELEDDDEDEEEENARPPRAFRTVEERQVWAGFYAAALCGATFAAANAGELVNHEQCAKDADEALTHFNARVELDSDGN